MAEFIPVDPFNLVIFGGTGDLSRRKLLPALYHRWLDNQIPENSRIIGSARSEMDDDAFRAMAYDAAKSGSGENWDEDKWAAFAQLLHYVQMDATNPKADWKGLERLLKSDDGRPNVFYLATSPSLYVPICHALGRTGLSKLNSRVVLEKPIGTDLASAREINEGVGEVFDETCVYRIDHYLGKESVQNLMVLRFANSLFEPLWSNNAIDHVQITVAESLGLESRADYYDKSGALRDMVQNHLLQLLCLTAMEPPARYDGAAIRKEKIKVLEALRPITEQDVNAKTVRAQYREGIIGGNAVPAYASELSGETQSRTETFVALKAEIDNWRWSGVPFYLRTGKRMQKRYSEIMVRFKPVPYSIFGADPQRANRLVIRLQPDESVKLFIQIKEPGPGGLRFQSLPLNLSYAEKFTLRYPDAYERLLMDVVRGNLSLFMHREEIEAAWRWIDGILGAWGASDKPLPTYPAGTDGPREADLMLDRDGRNWWDSHQN